MPNISFQTITIQAGQFVRPFFYLFVMPDKNVCFLTNSVRSLRAMAHLALGYIKDTVAGIVVGDAFPFLQTLHELVNGRMN